MKRYFNYFLCLMVVLSYWQQSIGQIVTTTEETFYSLNAQTDTSISSEDMAHLNYGELFRIDADLSGGIIGEVGVGGEIRLEVYAFDDTEPDGKGKLVYGIYTNEDRTTYGGNTWGVFFGEVEGIPITASSDDIKKLTQNARIYIPPSQRGSCATTFDRIFYGVFTLGFSEFFIGDCKTYLENQPVIVEATVENATFRKFKVPGMGEFDALPFFRSLPPGHACNDSTTVACETLREFRHGDFEKAIITAHRGFWGYGNIPEGTMEALQNAYNNDYVSIEIDILQTKDEELVLMHDQAVNRMTNLPDTYEGCFTDPTNSNSFSRTDTAWLKNLNYNSTTTNVLLADQSTSASYPAVSTGKYVDRRGQVNTNSSMAILEDALDYVKGKPILLSLDIKEQNQDRYISTLKKCIQAAKNEGVLHQMVFKPGSAARIDYQVYEDSLKAAGLWEDFAYKSNVIVILFPPKANPLDPIAKENVDGWMNLPSLICFEFIYKYDNLNTDALLKDWAIYGNKSVISYVKERGFRTGINWEISTDCRGLPNGRGQYYDRGTGIDQTPSGATLGVDMRNNPEWVLSPPGNNNAPGAIVTDRPDVTQTLLELLGRYNTYTKRN